MSFLPSTGKFYLYPFGSSGHTPSPTGLPTFSPIHYPLGTHEWLDGVEIGEEVLAKRKEGDLNLLFTLHSSYRYFGVLIYCMVKT